MYKINKLIINIDVVQNKIFKILGAGSRNNITLGIIILIMINNVNIYSHFMKDEYNLYSIVMIIFVFILYLYINNIFYFKLFNILKKINLRKKNIRNYKYEYNKYYSTRGELNDDYKNDKLNQMRELDDLNKNKTNFYKSFKGKTVHPLTIERGNYEDGENVEIIFVSETTTNKPVKEGTGNLIEVEKFLDNKYIPKMVYKDRVKKEDLLKSKIIKEDTKFKYIVEEENKKIDLINNSEDFKEFDMDEKKGEIKNYNKKKWDKNETFEEFINKFKD